MALVWILKMALKDCASSLQPSVFYDLGSGSGRMVASTALLHPQLRRCAGIEIIGALHEVAEAVRLKMRKVCRMVFPVIAVRYTF